MSVFEHSQWEGFPFTPSQIRAGRKGPDCDINASFIPDALVPVADDPAIEAISSAPTSASLRLAPHKGCPIRRQLGLRLLHLQAFIWGSGAMPPQPRTHPDHTLIWVTDGRVQLDFPREQTVLHAGDLRHIPAGTAFAAVPLADAKGHVALISTRLAGGAEPPLPVHGMAVHMGHHAAQFEATLRELAVETLDPDVPTFSRLMNLLSLSLRQLPPTRPAEAAKPAAPDHTLIERFLVLAGQRLGSGRSVAELAAELHSTTGALDQACMATRGKRAVEMIHDLQLERAADLLRGTDWTTLRIAADLGYSSHGHFIRAFVAATGRTPDAFRAQSC
jgi:AraC family transcriptional activator of pobA